MLNRKQWIALLLCVSMVLLLILSSAFIACEAGHECVGEACDICECVARTEALLQSFALLGIVLSALHLTPAVSHASQAKEKGRRLAVPTPVRWKVRLND